MKRAKNIDQLNGERLAMDPATAAVAVDMSLSYIRGQIREGKIRVTRLGRRVLIRREELTRFLDANTESAR